MDYIIACACLKYANGNLPLVTFWPGAETKLVLLRIMINKSVSFV